MSSFRLRTEDRQSGQAARAPEGQGKQHRAEWALRRLLACLLRSRVDLETHIHALVVATQRDLGLGKRATRIGRQIRAAQGNGPAIAAGGCQGECGGRCLSLLNAKRGWVRDHCIAARWCHRCCGDSECYGAEVLAAKFPVAA